MSDESKSNLWSYIFCDLICNDYNISIGQNISYYQKIFWLKESNSHVPLQVLQERYKASVKTYIKQILEN